MEKDNRFFTILFLPSNPARVKKLILSDLLMRSLAVSAIILVLTSTVMFLDYISVKKKAMALSSLREKTKVQDVQLKGFADKINDLEVELNRMKELDARIRNMTNIKSSETHESSLRLSLAGKGGIETTRLSFNGETLRQMMSKLDKLDSDLQLQDSSLNDLHDSLKEREAIREATPSIWPVKGYLSSGYGERISPFDGGNEIHRGIDISAPMGSPVVASTEGTVTFAGRYNDLGNSVIITNKLGYKTTYGHLSKILVSAGQSVRPGVNIGLVGSTGRSTGAHLHYEVSRNGTKVNPLTYLN